MSLLRFISSQGIGLRGWRNWLASSIVNRITLFAIGITVALTVLIGSISYGVMVWMVRSQVQLVVEQQASLAAQPLENDLNDFIKDIAELSRNSFIANGLVDSVGREVYLRPFLRDHRPPLQKDIDIALGDFNAVPIAANRATSLEEFTSLPGAKTALRERRPTFEIQQTADGGMLWLFYPVVFPPTGMAEGVIMARLDLTQLFADDAAYAKSFRLGDVTLANAKGNALDAVPDEHIVFTRGLQLVTPLDNLNAELRLGQPRDVAYQGMHSVILGHILIGALVLLMAFFVARKSARRLAAPLVALSYTADSIASGGELAMTMPVNSNDEVGRLAQAFDAMLHRLRLSYADLEARVQERTAELSRINTSLSAEIARRQHSESELVAARNVAEAASRAKSEFLANMSHEIRTPMNAVLGLAYLLGESSLTAEQRKTLEMIRTSGQSLLAILNDILDLSKIEAGRMELCSATFRLQDMLDALAGVMAVSVGDKNVELAIGVEPGVPDAVVGDMLRLQQVLVNLVGNAIKFTHRGEVALLVSMAGQEGDLVQLQFTVRDSGIGIDPSQQGRLFSPFSQADGSTTRRFGGTGLGLAICKRLVDLMQGSITVASTPAVGSVFTVMVPLQMAEGREDVSAVIRNADIKRLLVVDPHPTSLDCLEKTIVALGWQVDGVATPEAAAALLQAGVEQGSVRYDAVVVSRTLETAGAVSGLSSLKVNSANSGLPLIWLARTGIDTTREEGEITLRKPVTMSALVEALRVVEQRRLGEPCQLSSSTAMLDATGPSTSRGERHGQRLGGARILVVEDNALNQLVARGILERAGASVEVAENGIEAVELLRGDAGRFDLVLMDVQMPRMDGFATTQVIRGELKLRLPVLAMTAGVLAFEKEQCLTAGMDDFIPKPIDMGQMLGVIGRYWKRAGEKESVAAEPTSESASGVEGVIDLSALESLAMENDEYRNNVFQLVRDVIQQGSRPVNEAVAAWNDGRSDDAARRMHNLRGTAGSLGAYRVAAATIEAEQAIRARRTDEVPDLLCAVERELKTVLASAQAWLEARPVS